MEFAKHKRLVKKLIELTNAGEINWTPSLDENAFEVSFRDNTVRIDSVNSRTGESEDDIRIQLINAEGQVVESFTDIDLKSEPDEDGLSQPWYRPMSNLYSAARRKALGVEKALNELLADLDKIGDIPF